MSRICLMHLYSYNINLQSNMRKNCSFLTNGTNWMKIMTQVFTGFYLSVLQQEVDQGFQIQVSPEDHCHCFKRNISDIQYYLSSKQASKYIDIHQLRPVVNARLYEAHQNFIDSIHARLRHTNIYETNVSWGKDGINPISNRSDACYLERLCSDFQKIVITHFNRMTCSKNFPEGLDARKRKQVYRAYSDEILEHVQHCRAL
ncbi:uncharacterized protein LOC122455372 isoform X4 [Dermochelys coriacea]|nr:uncharacterized protein LOC122455372 isoform X4 [Dermochelys coriacea]